MDVGRRASPRARPATISRPCASRATTLKLQTQSVQFADRSDLVIDPRVGTMHERCAILPRPFGKERAQK